MSSQRTSAGTRLSRKVSARFAPRFRVSSCSAIAGSRAPTSGQGRAAGELRVALDDVFGSGPVDEVVVEGAVHRPEGEEAGIRAPDVERGAERVVEEDAVGAALAQHDVERHGDVEGVGVVGVGVGVRSSTSRRRSRRDSARACPARPSSRPGRRRVRRRAAASRRAWCGREGHAAPGIVLVERRAVRGCEGDAEGRVGEGDAQGRRAQDGRRRADLDLGRGIAGGGVRIAYEWSRPRDGPGAKRTRTTWGVRAETATVPCAFWNTRVERSRRGAGIPPSEAHWAAARETGSRATTARASARARRRTRFTGDLPGPRGPAVNL
jgi:hypothetical protein